MKDKYRSTIDKVKFDEQAKAKMKTNLLTRNVKKNYSFKYATILAAFFFTSLFLISTINDKLPESIYTVGLHNDYYDNELYKESDYVLSIENELLTIDIGDWQIVKVTNINYEIDNNIACSRGNALNVLSGESIEFRILGGLISKEDWDSISGNELADYNGETYIKVLSNYLFEVKVDSIYAVENNDSEFMRLE